MQQPPRPDLLLFAFELLQHWQAVSVWFVVCDRAPGRVCQARSSPSLLLSAAESLVYSPAGVTQWVDQQIKDFFSQTIQCFSCL